MSDPGTCSVARSDDDSLTVEDQEFIALTTLTDKHCPSPGSDESVINCIDDDPFEDTDDHDGVPLPESTPQKTHKTTENDKQ